MPVTVLVRVMIHRVELIDLLPIEPHEGSEFATIAIGHAWQ
jgi:hypothetical protein